MDKNNIDVAFLSETNPKNNSNTDENNKNKNLNLIIEGYKCEENPSGRGVCIFYREDFDVFRLDNIESIYNPSIFCKVVITKDVYFNVGLIYRSPNCTYEECQLLNKQITAASKQLHKPDDNLIILGDFNYPEIKWETLTSPANVTHKATEFLNTVESNQLTQLIDNPTHYRTTQNPTLIDLVLVKDSEIVNEVSYDAPFGKSHHQILALSLNIKTTSIQQTSERLMWNKGNFDDMRVSVNNVNWDELLNEETDINCWINEITNVILDAQEQYVPKIKIKHKHKI